MPTKPPRLSPAPPRTLYATNGEGDKKGSWSSTDFNYNKSAWKRTRNHVLSEEPLCRECKKKGKIVQATDVDHILPISEGGNPWDLDNLQPLCSSCHKRKTAIESNRRRGKRI